MATMETAAVGSMAFAALLVGHHLGDHPIQRNADVQAKGTPDDQQLATGTHPWTGWPSCLRHVATYALTQAAALALVVTVVPLTWPGATAALATSASTHAVIDRRWIVRAIIRAKGADDWPQGPYQVDQALHYGMLLIAAILAATISDAAELAVVVAICAGLVVGALGAERRRARSAAARIGDPTRL